MRRILTALLFLLLAWPVQFARSQAVSIRPDAITGTGASVSCATTATQLVAANARRRAVLFSAPSGNTETIFVGVTNGVTIGTGIPVAAGGNLGDDTYIGAWFCIVTTTAQPLRTLETTR